MPVWGADVAQHGVHAARAEGADVVVVQRRAVDGPDGRDGCRELLLVLRELLQFVERHRFEVDRPGQRVQLPPCPDHQRGVVVVGERGVFRIGVGLPHARDRERVGREERAVDVVVAVAYFVDALLGGADAVLENAVFDHRLAVVAQDAVHLGRVEEVGEEDVGDRHEDESDQDLADQTVGAEPERGRHHAVRENLRLVCQLLCACPKRFGSESVSFFAHRGKISFNRMQI